MPKLSRAAKREWDFFINPSTGRRGYNTLCRRCLHDCKQSYRTEVLLCPGYQSRRKKGAENGDFGPSEAPSGPDDK